jgi:hypothetical protein
LKCALVNVVANDAAQTNLDLVEDSEHSDGVDGSDEGAKEEGLEQANAEALCVGCYPVLQGNDIVKESGLADPIEGAAWTAGALGCFKCGLMKDWLNTTSYVPGGDRSSRPPCTLEVQPSYTVTLHGGLQCSAVQCKHGKYEKRRGCKTPTRPLVLLLSAV